MTVRKNSQLIRSVGSAAPRHQTIEERRAEEFENFRADAAITVVSAMADIVSDIANRVVSMVHLSKRSEFRGKYQILTDYISQNPDIANSANAVRKNLDRYAAEVSKVIALLTRFSGLIKKTEWGSGDCGDDFISRIDSASALFGSRVDGIRKAITAQFRKYKCSDPVMFYAVMYAVYIASRHDAICDYVSTFAIGFDKRGPFAPLLRLSVKTPLVQMAHRCLFRDKQGRDLVLLFDEKEKDEWQRTTAKKSWQIKHRDNMPVVIDVRCEWMDDAILRPTYELESYIMQLDVIDQIIASGEGHDPEYRHDWKMKRIQSCANSFEQAMINNAICAHRWVDVPRRMREFIDHCDSRQSISSRHRPRAVVGFELRTITRGGRAVIDTKTGKPAFQAVFIGIWRSAYEAEQELCVSRHSIMKSVRMKAVNDGHNHVWLSIDDYLSMTYNTMAQVKPEVAAELLRLIPDIRVRSTHEIASPETKVLTHTK